MAFYGNQYTSRMQYENQRALQSYGPIKELRAMAVLELKRGFTDAIKSLGTAVDGELRAMAHGFGRQDRAAFQEIHQRVGLLAQDSVKRSFDQLVTAREGPASRSHYRPGQDRLPRALRQALASPDFFEATPDGLRFVNVSMLDREARHWHRINFGAAPRGGGSTARFPVTFQNVVVANFGFDEGPSPDFSLPPGFWFGVGEGDRVGASAARRGQDVFFPAGQRPSGARGLQGQAHGRRQQARRTQGVRATNFLDAGLRRIGEEFPRAYEQHYEKIFSKFVTGQRKIAVKPILHGNRSLRVG